MLKNNLYTFDNSSFSRIYSIGIVPQNVIRMFLLNFKIKYNITINFYSQNS